MTREDIKTINDIVHKTIYGFFDICGDEETPMTDKDKLLLEVNKAVCNNIKDLEQEQKTGHWKQISPARIYECDICGQNVMTDDISAYRYCHGCGAKMIEPQESEEQA
jgi:DNA-directed RNA polymerase subunit RPC12/RpoP